MCSAFRNLEPKLTCFVSGSGVVVKKDGIMVAGGRQVLLIVVSDFDEKIIKIEVEAIAVPDFTRCMFDWKFTFF